MVYIEIRYYFFVVLTYLMLNNCCLSAQQKHEYVDLGLPSGTLWATCNIGADNPWDFGEYYAWGETTPKTRYSWNNYKYAANGDDQQLTKYCTFSAEYGFNGFVDNITVLQPSDDAATANWGSEWRMPTEKEWDELKKQCEWIWTENYKGKGKNGYLVSRNGNQIFIPAAGYRGYSFNNANTEGNYWTSTLYSSPECALELRFFYSSPESAFDLNYTNFVFPQMSYRSVGQSIRAVRSKK